MGRNYPIKLATNKALYKRGKSYEKKDRKNY